MVSAKSVLDRVLYPDNFECQLSKSNCLALGILGFSSPGTGSIGFASKVPELLYGLESYKKLFGGTPSKRTNTSMLEVRWVYTSIIHHSLHKNKSQTTIIIVLFSNCLQGLVRRNALQARKLMQTNARQCTTPSMNSDFI